MKRKIEEQVHKSQLPPKSSKCLELLRWMVDQTTMNHLGRHQLVAVFNTMSYKLERFKRWKSFGDDERDLLIDVSDLMSAALQMKERHDQYYEEAYMLREEVELEKVRYSTLEEEIEGHRNRINAYKALVKDLEQKIERLESEAQADEAQSPTVKSDGRKVL